ncbi:MAG: molybdopterin-dependent oxidoreductase [Myxococcales bacterium]|jgi:CO/xanthine dehydrogenase Mo-binding subunit|nr:molybdopterin-dependent oxidoreductase [Myxococcales bacterium]
MANDKLDALDAKYARDFKVIGHSVQKIDAMGMACGLEEYVADHDLTGALVGYIVPSPHAHARIVKIDATRARAVKGVHAVLTYKDVPRHLHTTAGQGYVEPSPYDTAILDSKMRLVGDHVALIAADTREIAEEAGRVLLEDIEWEVLTPVLDADHAMDPGASVIHDEPDAYIPIPVPYEPQKNMASAASMGVGDMDAVLKTSHLAIDETYSTHYAQHCPIETHVCLGSIDGRDRLKLITSTQVPYHARRITAQALGIPVKRIRVNKPRIGGGFGTKQEVLLEPLVGALVLATRRKILMRLSRAEEFVSRVRHPIKTRMQAGFNADGTVNGMRMEVLSNTGAYGSHALTVMCNCGSKVLPLYRMKTVAFDAKAVYTNLPVGGAYRGYGATQSAFAMEVMMDEVAEKLGIDPLELRRRNHIQPGEGSPVFAALGEGKPGVEQKIGSCGLSDCLTLGAEAIGWEEKRGKIRGTGPKKRGIGMCALMQGSSIPEIDMASVSIKMNDDGSFVLAAGATDLGTGSDTVLAQAAAEILGVEVTDIIVHSSDTDLTPFDVGAYASSTTYLSGEASRRTAIEVAKQIREVAADMFHEEKGMDPRPDPDTLVLKDKQVFAPNGESVTLNAIGLRSLYERDQHQIGHIGSAISHKSPPPFSAHFAEVEVDEETGKVRIVKYVTTMDCGTALNPKLAEGQVEGAVVNGLSFALTEEYLFNEKGRMQNANFADYKIFNTDDMPEMVTIMVPTYEETGPFGGKSVSEIGINGPIPAIANAIYDAVGVRIHHAPFTPEKVLKAIQEKKAREAKK